jgi:hypothetical protein
MSYRWVPELLEILDGHQYLTEFAVQGIAKVKAEDGDGWTMQTLMSDLKRRIRSPKQASSKPEKLSITNGQNREILTIQRDPKRLGVYEIRVTVKHSLSPDELEQHLVMSLKNAWRDVPSN